MGCLCALLDDLLYSSCKTCSSFLRTRTIYESKGIEISIYIYFQSGSGKWW
jgi:hypothetical protein